MIKQLMMKWFGITEPPCRSCEILQMELNRVITEKNDLLTRILDRDKPVVEKESKEEFRPITPQHVPWRVRQQMMEAEDAKRAQLLKQSADDIAKLEKELGISKAAARNKSGSEATNASKISETVPIHAGDSTRDEAEEGYRSFS